MRVERFCAGPYCELFARQSRPNWATWGDQRNSIRWGRSVTADTRLQAVATNPRRHERNTLRGFVDLRLPSGMIVKGCTVHMKGPRAWVGLPGRPYKDAAGVETWANIIEFADKEAGRRFQQLALSAAAEHFPEIAVAEEEQAQ